MTRSADTVFRGSFSAPYSFDDVSERGALKITSLLRVTAPRHFSLWLTDIGGPQFFEETGLFIPIVAFDLFVTDEPILQGADFEIDITIRLGRQLDDRGQTRRLISESVGEVFSTHARSRERVLVARNIKHNALSRNDPDPAKRRVTELPASMDLGRAPQRIVSFPSVHDLAQPPEGFVRTAAFEDSEPHFWSYQQTDQNRHIHAMDYVRVMEMFTVDRMAQRELSPRDHLLERIRVAFRAPCFTGERYHRAGTLYSGPEGRSLVQATLHKVEDDAPLERPAVATQMLARPLAASLRKGAGPEET